MEKTFKIPKFKDVVYEDNNISNNSNVSEVATPDISTSYNTEGDLFGDLNVNNFDNYHKQQIQQHQLQQHQLQQHQLQQQSSEPNPFDSPEYNNIATPDVPLQYGGGMAELLLSDKEVPELLKQKYWWIFNKDNVLTFLDKKRKQDKLRAFDTAIIDTMNSMDSYDDYTFDKELEYGLMRNAFDVKMDRAVGTSNNNKNERIIMQSQFSENKQVNEQSGSGAVKEGFFKRLLGRR